MRLLYLSADPGVPVFGGKGASIHLRSLARALHGLGHDVLIASPRLEPGPNHLPDGIQWAPVPGVKPRECASAQEVIRRCEEQTQAVTALVQDHALEAIYERYSLMGVAGARTAAVLDVPLAVEVNAPLREEERRFRQLVHESLAMSAERETFAAARRVFVVSRQLRRWLVGQGVEPDKVEVMPNAPPVHAFSSARVRGSDPELVVGFAGGLKRWHGIEHLIEAFRLALDGGGRMRLEILGRGPADDIVDRCGLPEERLRRLGQVSHDQALRTLEGWDIGVAPFSNVPDFYFSPLKLFEYMAAGLCPVVSDVGELSEIVEHGRAGVVVPPDCTHALAAALLQLDRDRTRLSTTAARAREVAAALPSWTDSAERVLATLREPVKHGPRGPAAITVRT